MKELNDVFRLVLKYQTVLLLAILVISVVVRYRHPISHSVTEVPEFIAERVRPEGNILIGGDVMLARPSRLGVVTQDGSVDWTFPWVHVAETLRRSDLVVLNHEGASTTSGGPFEEKKYQFKFLPESMEGFQFAGVDVVSFANNHALDFGFQALCDSVVNAKKYSIAVVGAGCNEGEAKTPHISTIAGTKIAVLGVADFYKWASAKGDAPGLTPFSYDYIARTTKELKHEKDIDVVIVTVHMGDEYQLQSNERQQLLYRSFIDAGVDVVVGHHPHVVQEIEQYNGGVIYYSVGNFIFDQPNTVHTMRGYLASITVSRGKVVGTKAIKVQMNKQYQPMVVNW